MTLATVWAIVAVAGVIAVFLRHNRLNQLALSAALSHARNHDLQMLDQSVILTRLGLCRRLSLERHYRFEFTRRGDRRYRGWVILCGERINRVYAEATVE